MNVVSTPTQSIRLTCITATVNKRLKTNNEIENKIIKEKVNIIKNSF